jgi:hypothetical protein
VYASHTTAYLAQPITRWHPAHFSLIRYCRVADVVEYRE